MSLDLHPKFVVDEEGNRQSVILPISEFERLIEAQEDREDLAIAESRLQSTEKTIPWDEVRREMANRPRS